jgi:serine/tyrosine/threonine adenylyltransferase
MNTSTSDTDCFNFQNSYTSLTESFYELVNPEKLPKARLLKLNDNLAQELGLKIDCLRKIQEVFAGNLIPPSSRPLAMAYAGHQFGHFVPQLGDGRAVLLGEVVNSSGQRFDVQLKGSGRTRFSRRGDGKAPLGAVVREYLISEALHGLGIPTTRSLAIVDSGETIYREGPTKGGVLTRVADSHIRVGTFEYFAYRGDSESLKLLADYTIKRHYPEIETEPNPYVALLRGVLARQAKLVAKWQGVGFIHGVMNTDNCTVSGETIDFGPCAFMDSYDARSVFSSIDVDGRYAYQNQPTIVMWNLERFAETLLPLFGVNSSLATELATAELDAFKVLFRREWLETMGRKLGFSKVSDIDLPLIRDFFIALSSCEVDFTLGFRYLGDVLVDSGEDNRFWQLFSKDIEPIRKWHKGWVQRLEQEAIPVKQLVERLWSLNPLYIARNHLVESAISAVVEHSDFSLFSELVAILENPYRELPTESGSDLVLLASPPKFRNPNYQTFCGT